MKTKKDHADNVYAKDLKDDIKHISEVQSGKKGYYCLGCDAEVVAKKGDIKMHHFAHFSTDVNIERKCTYSDETYRHKIAKEILQRIKQIKVPILYKYPPVGMTGPPMKLKKAQVIKAETVKIERQFYEDENGNIQYGQNIDFEKGEKKNLLIKADVAFFNKDNKPILLIEIVATHKIDKVKLSKLWRLGIDTVQVTIPKDSEEEIENCFYRTNRTKWIFNYERETTPFLSIPKGNTKGILPFDEFEGKLSKTAESFACRSSQIGNLIRGLKKCLGSEPYRRIEQTIGTELTRVAKNTKRNRERLFDLRAEHRAAVEGRLESAENEFREEKEEFDREEKALRKKDEDLDRRYSTKREKLANAQREYRPECQSEIERVERFLEERGGTKASFAEQVRALGEEEEDFERRISEDAKREREAILVIEKRRGEFPKEYVRIEREIREGFAERRDNQNHEFIESEKRTRNEVDESGRETIRSIENRDIPRDPGIRERVKKLVHGRERLYAIREGKSRIKALERAKRAFDSGAYKSWD